MTVAALYVDPVAGPYPALIGPEQCWGIERDAKAYSGPGPVIAHPPCGPWGSMRQFCTKQDPSCAPWAATQLRHFGGVLEHPEGSHLWRRMGLPRPFRRIPGIVGGEWSLCVDQVRWGHPCRKRTWLFFVGVRPEDLPPIPPPRGATHTIGGTKEWRAHSGKPTVGSGIAKLTPPDFAAWLIAAVSA